MLFAIIAILIGLLIIIGIGAAIGATHKFKPELAAEAEYTKTHDKLAISIAGWSMFVLGLLFLVYVQ